MALVIGAPSSNSGKTLLSILLTAWAHKRKKSIQTFKIGPDYLDPQLLTLISKKPCRNLDKILCGTDWIKSNFNEFSSSSELTLIEGVMGLYDGIGSSSKGSTADISKILKLPILLIIDASGQGSSIAALLKGFRDFDNDLNIAGVILNNVNSTRHKNLLTEVLSSINIKVLGCIPKIDSLYIPNKSLGLIPAHEITDLEEKIDEWSFLSEKFLNITSIEKLLKSPKNSKGAIESISIDIKDEDFKKDLTIAIARDNAFHFRYPETKESLERLGFKIIDWEIIKDQSIPKEAKGLIIPGGFPEEFTEEISQSKRSLNSIKNFFGKHPIYAECGGMLILGKSLTDSNGKDFPMAGLLPFKAKKGSLSIGYRKAISMSENLISNKGDVFMGHEFHRWELEVINKKKNLLSNNHNPSFNKNELSKIWEVQGWGIDSFKEGWGNQLFHASWIHLHWASSPKILKRWSDILRS
ncbi:cobyrinate a,c-diamide synthase [Prochlorococcus marinus]|uniref:cobyrinate a,c-diamide synthase n=1 Tax=Prochlorococcus marinus TaxID=1219 RepID=UPI0022B2ED5C|nr:cobyrinate a,c-diamide synthase [Prochlorococcus marinus]